MAEHEEEQQGDEEQQLQEQAEEEQQEEKKNPKLRAKPKRMLVPENVKRSDIAPWDRNDKKTSWLAWN